MQCAHPVLIVDFRQVPYLKYDKENDLIFEPNLNNYDYWLHERHVPIDYLYVAPCNRCSLCKLNYSRMWRDRLLAHYEFYLSHNKPCYFVTLTYDDANLTYNEVIDSETGELLSLPVLNYRDVQLFFKRLRKSGFNFTYFLAGEYGSKSLRPHYHVLFFGLELNDLKLVFGHKTSDVLVTSWRLGNIDIGDINLASISYVSQYSLKKVSLNDSDTSRFVGFVPEFIRMSKGIASNAFDASIYDNDSLVIRNESKAIVSKPFKYFDKLLDKIDPDTLSQVKSKRIVLAREFFAQQTANTDLDYMQYLQKKEQALKFFFKRKVHALD